MKIFTASALLCFGAINACLAANQTAQVFPNYTATYQIQDNGHHLGTIVQQYQQQQNHYRFNSITHTKILFFSDILTESSEGAVTSTGFEPGAYHLGDSRKGSLERVTFNWQSKLLNSILRGDRKFLQTQDGMQDNLSYQLQLRYALLNQQLPLNFTVVSNNTIHHYQFKIINQDAKLKTPLGLLDTIQVQSPLDGQTYGVMYWFATKYNDVLVQSMSLKNGNPEAIATISDYQAQADSK